MATFRKLEDIEVWKRSCRLAVDIYKLTAVEEISKDWSLRDQIRRSSVSIPSNIAEGYERDSNAEFSRFLKIAKGSCGELRTQLYIVKALELIPQEIIDKFLKETIELSSMLQGMITYLQAKQDK